jgi:carboxypeptidase family protein/TonB-dependent receptor-like protein
MLRHPLAACFVAALLNGPISAAGQTVGTATGSIVGTIRDTTGAVLPNVTITISSSAIMGVRTTSTAADGTYRISVLPPGEYRLSFALNGFRTLEREVRIALGFTATVDVEMQLASQREEITVTKQNSDLDRRSTAIAQTFNSRQLADLPVSRSLGGLLGTTQALQLSTIEVGGSPGFLTGAYSAYGKSNSPRHTVEGIVVTGLFGFGFPLDYGSFEEVSVLTGAHGAEWGTAGIHTQVVTKSGANRYRAGLYADYENRHWQSSNLNERQIGRVAPEDGGLAGREANQLWHYRDVNADLGGFVRKDRLWWYASVRDQATSSWLVNFPVEPHRTHLTNYGGKATYRISPGSRLVGYGQRGLNHQPTRLDPFGPAGSGLVPATAINETKESTADQHNAGWVWKGEWNAVIDDRLIVDARAGQFGTEQAWNARNSAPRFEDIDTLLVWGGNRDWQSSGRRNQAFANASYLTNGWLGSHDLKFGGEMIRWAVAETWLSGYPGNVVHILRSGEPSAVFILDTPSRSESGVWSYSAYAADSWQLMHRLTINAGLRFDRYRLFLPEQEHPAGSPTAQKFAAVPNLIDWNVVVPRIAAVYDLTGDGRTLARAAFAQYGVAPGNALALNANPNSNPWWTRHEWTDPDGSGMWERGEEGRLLSRRGGVAVESMDQTLQLPALTEATAWFERELAAGVGLRTGVVWRREDQQYARQNVNQPFDAFTVPVALPDPGPDGVAGTTDDGPAVVAYDLRPDLVGFQPRNEVRNVPRSSSEYWTWEIGATRRARGRWSLTAGFAHTWNRDQAQNYSGQTIRNNAYPLTPNDLINTGEDGGHEFTTWTAKAHGTYETPWGLRITPLLRHQSGQPFGRTFTHQLRHGTVTVLAEPVGTRRTDNVTIVDLRVEKSVRLNENRRIAWFLDVFNCLNANPEQNTIWSSGASFLRPVTIVPPRIARIGMKVDW